MIQKATRQSRPSNSRVFRRNAEQRLLPAHVASIGGVQNFASNLAGIVTTTFTGVMHTITGGSFVVPFVAAGFFCVLGAAVYLFVVGDIAPLPPLARELPAGEVGTVA